MSPESDQNAKKELDAVRLHLRDAGLLPSLRTDGSFVNPATLVMKLWEQRDQALAELAASRERAAALPPEVLEEAAKVAEFEHSMGTNGTGIAAAIRHLATDPKWRAAAPQQEERTPPSVKGVCPTHGKAVLMTHVDDAEPCSDFLTALPPTEARQIVDEQAEDEGLWFEATTATEAYLQGRLRELHAAVERDSGGETGPLATLRERAAPQQEADHE